MFKKVVLALLISVHANAARVDISGSDTLAGVMVDAIVAAGLERELNYIGGGTGVGEKAIINKEIGITAMSRPFSASALASAQAAGVTPVGHVIALDGLSLFVNQSNPVAKLDIPMIASIFTCQVTKWEQVPNSGKVGNIVAYRRDDKSGTTDTFKALTGVRAFGPCVTVLAETTDIADRTATEDDAIGYAGLSGKKSGNRETAIATTAANAGMLPTVANIRSGAYPLSRKLYIYEASGAMKPSVSEQKLLNSLLDRSFLDPILQAHDFVTLN